VCGDEGIWPGLLFKPTIDWKLEDLKGKLFERFREIRDENELRVIGLLNENERSPY
jgi:hypothetical protein